MTRFTELLSTGEVHSAYEGATSSKTVQQTTTVDVDTAPASVEDPVNPEPLDFTTMSKLQLETYGRTIGIELDRRHSRKRLIRELEQFISNR